MTWGNDFVAAARAARKKWLAEQGSPLSAEDWLSEGTQLSVATDCSGLESPIVALSATRIGISRHEQLV